MNKVRFLSDSELFAYAIKQGDEESIRHFKSKVTYEGDEEFVMPVLQSLNLMYGVFGPSKTIGDLAEKCLEDPQLYFNGLICGGLLTLITLHKPTSLMKCASKFTGNYASQQLITESLLQLRVALGHQE